MLSSAAPTCHEAPQQSVASEGPLERSASMLFSGAEAYCRKIPARSVGSAMVERSTIPIVVPRPVQYAPIWTVDVPGIPDWA